MGALSSKRGRSPLRDFFGLLSLCLREAGSISPERTLHKDKASTVVTHGVLSKGCRFGFPYAQRPPRPNERESGIIARNTQHVEINLVGKSYDIQCIRGANSCSTLNALFAPSLELFFFLSGNRRQNKCRQSDDVLCRCTRLYYTWVASLTSPVAASLPEGCKAKLHTSSVWSRLNLCRWSVEL